jgi:peptide/nickel transport system ATP-binding protein
VRRWVGEPLKIHGIRNREERVDKIISTLDQCGLKPPRNFLDQYPHELSGGQRQRVALARALVLDPSVIIADEPTSMLDVSVRAGILKVMNQLVEETGVTILYISHDLSLLRYICDRIGIMYRGQLAEVGPVDSVLREPAHPYTQSLLRAVPRLDPGVQRERVRIPPEVNENIDGIQGCPFKQRCEYRFEKCDENVELMGINGADHEVACHLYDPEVDRPLPEY